MRYNKAGLTSRRVGSDVQKLNSIVLVYGFDTRVSCSTKPFSVKFEP
jgi:hypothetical protein